MAAGLIIARRAVKMITELEPEEWVDITSILRPDADGLADGPRRLCEAVGVTFAGHFFGPAFNNGDLSGQTQSQVHGHFYPVIEEQFSPTGVRNGVGAMVERHFAAIHDPSVENI